MECKICHKTGHFAKVCNNKEKSKVNNVSFDENSSVHSSHSSQHSKSSRYSTSSSHRSSNSFKHSTNPGNSSIFSARTCLNEVTRTVTVGSKRVQALIDTGAEASIVPVELVRGKKFKKSPLSLHSFGSFNLNVLGTIVLPITYKEKTLFHEFYVIANSANKKVILNLELSNKLNLIKELCETKINNDNSISHSSSPLQLFNNYFVKPKSSFVRRRPDFSSVRRQPKSKVRSSKLIQDSDVHYTNGYINNKYVWNKYFKIKIKNE